MARFCGFSRPDAAGFQTGEECLTVHIRHLPGLFIVLCRRVFRLKCRWELQRLVATALLNGGEKYTVR